MNQKELIETYSKADYLIPALKIKLVVGINNPELNNLLTQNRVKYAALITAFNPYSQKLSKEENERRNEELKFNILKKWNCIDSISKDVTSNEWEEQGYLIYNINLIEALSLAGSFGQHAILYIEKDRAVELILTGAKIKSNDDWRKKLLGH